MILETISYNGTGGQAKGFGGGRWVELMTVTAEQEGGGLGFQRLLRRGGVRSLGRLVLVCWLSAPVNTDKMLLLLLPTTITTAVCCRQL